jgi:hypothetical protein
MPTLNILDENIYYFTNVIKDPKTLMEYVYETDSYDIGDIVTPWIEWRSSYEAPEDKPFIYGKRKMFGVPSQTHYDKYKNLEYIYNEIKGATKYACLEYKKNKNILGKIFNYPNFVVSMYDTGVEMGLHHDTSDGDPFLKFSLVTYLNDDYEGGEIEFPNKGIKLKPKAGSIIIFPSIYPYEHASKKIKKGQKYMTTSFWLNDPENIDVEKFADINLLKEKQDMESYDV